MRIKNIKDKQVKIFALRNAQDQNPRESISELLEMNIKTSFERFDCIEPKELKGIDKAVYWGLISKAKNKADYKQAEELILNTYKNEI